MLELILPYNIIYYSFAKYPFILDYSNLPLFIKKTNFFPNNAASEQNQDKTEPGNASLNPEKNSQNLKNESDENGINKSQEFIYYNRKNHHLFLRLKAILYNEKKKPYYRKIVLRLFKYLFIYLEKIQSSTIKIITKHGNKYYFHEHL